MLTTIGAESINDKPAIARLDNFFVIVKDEKNQLVYYNKNEKGFVSENRASKWTTLEAAEDIFEDLKEEMALRQELEAYTDEFKVTNSNSKDQKNVSEYSREFIKRSHEDVMEQIKETVMFLSHAKEIADLLTKQISESDGSVLQDILHVVELGNPGVMGKLQVFNYLKQSRIKRREAKDLLSIINPLVPNASNSISLPSVNIALASYKKVSGQRTYNFKSEEMAKNLERYLPQDMIVANPKTVSSPNETLDEVKSTEKESEIQE